MNTSALLPLLLATDNPVLPSPEATRWALHVGWAAVLGAGTLWAGTRLSPAYRWGWALLMVLWALVPASASPTYWLGLAFQAPSLMAVLLCTLWLFSVARHPQRRNAPDLAAATTALVLGVVLGWILLLDTLAWWPVSVYSWGFSSAALGAVALLAVVVGAFGAFGAGFGPWAARTQTSAVVVLAVLGLFVWSRWPSGNLWDALLDPWLWGAMQWAVFRAGLRRWRARQAGPVTTRA